MKVTEGCPVCGDPLKRHTGRDLAFCQGVAQLILIVDRLGQLIEKVDAGPACPQCSHPVSMHGPEHKGCSVKTFQTGLTCPCDWGGV